MSIVAEREQTEYYRARELADLLRVSTLSVYRWIDAGQVKAVRLPTGTIRIPSSEVARLLSEPETEE